MVDIREQCDEDAVLLSVVHRENAFHHSLQVCDVARWSCLFSVTV